LRLAYLGPLQTADLAGLTLTRDVHLDLLPELDCSQAPSLLLEEKIRAGHLGAKSGQGFHTWPPERLRAVVGNRDKVLLKILREVLPGEES
jgi:3-hydroxybutyryl-CoA dehydrogenase